VASARDGDGAELPPVIRLAAVGRAAKAEEAVRIGISIEVECLDLPDARGDQAMDDIGFKVEVRLAGRSLDKEARIVSFVLDEAAPEGFIDFVTGLSDAWPDGGMDMFASRPKFLHRLDRRIRHASERAPPAGMGGADDDRLMVRKQHRRAIGGQDAEKQVRRVGDHCISPGALVVRPGLVSNYDFRGMDLVNRGKPGFRMKGGDRKPAIARNHFRIVAAAETDIEPRAIAHGHAAAAPEESVRQSPQADSANDLDFAQSNFRMMMSSSACSPTMKS